MRRKFHKTRIKRIRKIHDCFFCKQKTQPDYKDIEGLKHYITDRGKIIPRLESGVCQKHQKILTKSVKRARILALLPFIVRPT